mgnify:CR=1 FL=1
MTMTLEEHKELLFIQRRLEAIFQKYQLPPHEVIDLTIHTHTPKKFVKSHYKDVISRTKFIQSLQSLEDPS